MSRLKALLGKSETFNIGGEELVFSPLRLDEIHMFAVDEKAPMEVQVQMVTKLVSFYLKKAVPEATEDEIKGISGEHTPTIMEAIMKVNKFDKLKGMNMPKLQQTPATQG